MRERPAGQAGEDRFDDCVVAVAGFGLQHRIRAVGEHRMVAVGDLIGHPRQRLLGLQIRQLAPGQQPVHAVGRGLDLPLPCPLQARVKALGLTCW